jgi:hypothetical protein
MRFANSGTISIDHRAVAEQTRKIIFHPFIRRFKQEELLLHIALLADLSRYGKGLGVWRGLEPISNAARTHPKTSHLEIPRETNLSSTDKLL